MGGKGYGGGGRGRLYTYRYTVTTKMTCIKMGSDESHFNVSLTVRDTVTRQCPQTTTFEEKGEPPKRIRTEVLPAYQPTALPLGQTGSRILLLLVVVDRFYTALFSAVVEQTHCARMCFYLRDST